jgi:hypothetical protein
MLEADSEVRRVETTQAQRLPGVRTLVGLLDDAGLAPAVGFNVGSGTLTTVLSLSQVRAARHGGFAPQLHTSHDPPFCPLLASLARVHIYAHQLCWAPSGLLSSHCAAVDGSATPLGYHGGRAPLSHILTRSSVSLSCRLPSGLRGCHRRHLPPHCYGQC